MARARVCPAAWTRRRPPGPQVAPAARLHGGHVRPSGPARVQTEAARARRRRRGAHGVRVICPSANGPEPGGRAAGAPRESRAAAGRPGRRRPLNLGSAWRRTFRARRGGGWTCTQLVCLPPPRVRVEKRVGGLATTTTRSHEEDASPAESRPSSVIIFLINTVLVVRNRNGRLKRRSVICNIKKKARFNGKTSPISREWRVALCMRDDGSRNKKKNGKKET
jgi:hypothetical protein